MASNKILSLFPVLVLLTVAMFNSPVSAAEEFKVGDAVGWHRPDLNHTHFYSLWASRRKFHVGDSLRFEYKNDSVMVVDKWAYYHCNTSNPISVSNNGRTVIPLKNPGPIYFISGDTNHCAEGQRLFIDVQERHPKSHSPPATGTTPPGDSSEMAPAPSPASSSGAKVYVTLFTASVAAFLGYLIV